MGARENPKTTARLLILALCIAICLLCPLLVTLTHRRAMDLGPVAAPFRTATAAPTTPAASPSPVATATPRSPTPTWTPEPPAYPTPATPPHTPTPVALTYIVEPGDTLEWIAIRFGVTVASIIEANDLSDLTLTVGQELIIPTPTTAPTHTVRPTPSPRPLTPTGTAPPTLTPRPPTVTRTPMSTTPPTLTPRPPTVTRTPMGTAPPTLTPRPPTATPTPTSKGELRGDVPLSMPVDQTGMVILELTVQRPPRLAGDVALDGKRDTVIESQTIVDVVTRTIQCTIPVYRVMGATLFSTDFEVQGDGYGPWRAITTTTQSVAWTWQILPKRDGADKAITVNVYGAEDQQLAMEAGPMWSKTVLIEVRAKSFIQILQENFKENAATVLVSLLGLFIGPGGATVVAAWYLRRRYRQQGEEQVLALGELREQVKRVENSVEKVRDELVQLRQPDSGQHVRRKKGPK